MDVTELSDVELRESLKQYGITVGPIVASTRKVYEKKLLKFINSKDDSAVFSTPAPTPTTPNGTESKRGSSKSPKSPKSPTKTSPVQAAPEVHNQSDSDDCEESMRYLTEEEMAADRAALAARKNNKGSGICGRALSFAVIFVAIAVFAYFLIENAEQLKRLTETPPFDDTV